MMVNIFPPLLPFSVWPLSPLLCRSCLLSPQLLSRRNCHICRCVFGVCGELSLGFFYSAVLDLSLSKDLLAVWGKA